MPRTASPKKGRAVAPPPGVAEWIWGLLFSLKFGLVLLALLAVASIVGTVLPPPEGVRQYDFALAMVYKTWWYLGLLVLLAVNMLLATWSNLRHKIIPAMRPRFMRFPEFYQLGSPRRSVERTTPEALERALRGAGYRAWREGDHGHAMAGNLNRWGAPIAHVGVAIVIVAGICSVWTNHEGQITLAEGQTANQMLLTTAAEPHAVPLGFTVRCDDFDTAFFPRTRIPSHFISTVTINQSGQPPRTELVEVNRSVVADGWKFHQTSYGEVAGGRRYRLAVAGPDGAAAAELELSPGQTRALPGRDGVDLSLSDANPPAWELRKGGQTLARGVLGQAAAPRMALRAEQFEPDFALGADGQAASRSEDLNNPALPVTLIEDGRAAATGWLYSRPDVQAQAHALPGPLAFRLERIDGPAGDRVFRVAVSDAASSTALGTLDLRRGVAYPLPDAAAAAAARNAAPSPWRVSLLEQVPLYTTTITLTRNAAVPVVYFGCGVMLLGLVLAFFVRRREIFWWHEPAAGRVRLVGVYRHPRTNFDPRTARAIARLQGDATPQRAKETAQCSG